MEAGDDDTEDAFGLGGALAVAVFGYFNFRHVSAAPTAASLRVGEIFPPLAET